MFGRITQASIRQTYNNVRGHLYHGYGQLKRHLNTIDSSINMAARVYQAVQPALKDVVGSKYEGKITAAASNLKGDYNEMKRRIVDADERGQSVMHSLEKKVPELNL